MLFKKSQRGNRLLRQSFSVLWEQKKMLIFSLAGKGFFYLILISMTTFVWMVQTDKIDYNQFSSNQIWIGYGLLLLILGIGNIIVAYFNAAFTHCLLQYEQGQEISLCQAMNNANRRFWAITYWILFHFTFGLFINFFPDKLKEKAKINQLLSGLSWPYASFLIPPLLINEPMSFISTLKRSGELILNFAGKKPIINFSFFWINIFLRLLCFIPILISWLINQPLWTETGTVLTFFLLLIVSVLFNGISVVFLQAIYQYIAQGKTFPHFQTQDLATSLIRSIRLNRAK